MRYSLSAMGFRPLLREREFAASLFFREAKAEAPGRGSAYANSVRKRMIDLGLVLLATPIVVPLVLLLAGAIAASGQPPFFRQWRYGRGKVPFQIVKLRTMRIDRRGAPAFRQAARNDDRCTALGRMLRRTSLDELPQFWNVLLGDMSLVGPRPHPVELDDQFAPLVGGYDRRFAARPGITGLAQVSGARGETATIGEMRRRIARDVAYIKGCRLGLDLVILALTVVAVLRARQAY